MKKGEKVIDEYNQVYEVFSYNFNSEDDNRGCNSISETAILLDKENCDRITITWNYPNPCPISTEGNLLYCKEELEKELLEISEKQRICMDKIDRNNKRLELLNSDMNNK